MLETATWVIGTDLGLASIAMIFASAWVKVNRIDKLETHIDKLQEKLSKVDVLENKIQAIETGIEEIKQLIKEMK